ncbi:unnamed protein product, partial [Laminaria digitata]
QARLDDAITAGTTYRSEVFDAVQSCDRASVVTAAALSSVFTALSGFPRQVRGGGGGGGGSGSGSGSLGVSGFPRQVPSGGSGSGRLGVSGFPRHMRGGLGSGSSVAGGVGNGQEAPATVRRQPLLPPNPPAVVG